MATKTNAKAPETPSAPPAAPEAAHEEFAPDMAAGDFNLEDEFKPNPLVPGGKYYGNVMKVKRNTEDSTILWEVVLAENGGVCTDQTTPVDGSRVYARNYLPKPGDESEMTKDGKMNKRQAKINMIKQFSDSLKINMNSLAIIDRAIAESEWIGMAVIVDIGVREFEGRFSNEVKRMVKKEQ